MDDGKKLAVLVLCGFFLIPIGIGLISGSLGACLLAFGMEFIVCSLLFAVGSGIVEL
jgi:hypothetical protein